MDKHQPPKPVVLNYKGIDYTLDFNRKTVRRMEENGFDVTRVGSMPISGVLTLFYGAFQMHHRFVRQELAEEIWDAQKGKQKLLSALIALYTENINTLMDDEDDPDDDANPTWSFQ